MGGHWLLENCDVYFGWAHAAVGEQAEERDTGASTYPSV